MTTFALSTQLGLPMMGSMLTQSAAGSHARTSALPEKAQGCLGNEAGFGGNTPVLLASFDPSSLLWKTSQRCFIEGLATFSETWPRSGMTRNGIAYQLPPLVRLTDEIASGSLPTQSASGFEIADVPALLARRQRQKEKHKNGNGFGLTLAQFVKVQMFPTPTARDWKSEVCSPEVKARRDSETRGKTLPWVVGGQLNPEWVEWLMGFPLGWTDCADSETP